jgi:hypothetical protein
LMVAFGERRLGLALLVASCLVLVGIVLGRAVVETQAIEAGTVPVLLGAAGALAAVAVMFIGPVVCIAAIPALSIVPFLPKLSTLPRVDVGAADAFYAALVVWTVLELLRPSGVRRAAGSLRSTPILLFTALSGLSLAYVAAVDPGAFDQSLVSWLRLIQTFSIAFLAVLFLRSVRDVRIVLAAVALAGLVTVVVGVGGGLTESDQDAVRAGGVGVVGPNTLGLVSGLLVLMGGLGAFGPHLLHRVPLAIIGVVGLMEARSVGSLVGTSIALLLGLLLSRPQRANVPGLRAATAVTALVVALAVAYALAAAVRPGNVPTSDSFESNSAYHRAVVGAAGLELAERNPVIGVGWRRSSDPQLLGDPEIAAELRGRFPDAKADFFPDVEPTSVHNTYVQIAAELGGIGLAVLAFVLWTLGRDTRRLIQRAPPGSETRRLLWFLAWGVVLILVWLNDNPLYGGQPETVLLTVLVGAIAGLGRKAAHADSPAGC